MMLRIGMLLTASLTAFSVIPEETAIKWEEGVDEGKRKAYYMSCKQRKEHGCHMKAFENSLMWIPKISLK